jgi:hypothetical protein
MKAGHNSLRALLLHSISTHHRSDRGMGRRFAAGTADCSDLAEEVKSGTSHKLF